MNQLRQGEAAQSLGRAWAQAGQRRQLFATTDRDCAQALVGRVFRPHRLELPRSKAPMAVSMDYLPLGLLSMSHLRYGAAVDILPGPLERFYLLQIPIAGQAHIEAGEQAFVSDTDCASLLSPQPHLKMHWQAGNEQLLLRLEASTVQRFAQSWCGEQDLTPPEFEPRLPLDAHPALHEVLMSLIQFAGAAGDASTAATAYPLSAVQLQHRLVATLLGNQSHSHSERLRGSGPPLAPRSVRRVEEFIISHCHEALTPTLLAAEAGVSVRSLFLGFQRYRGVSPMRLLRELRLRRVHDDLLCAPAGSHVTDIALRWGFYHLGRFGQEYREMFGESARETMAAAQQA